MYFVDEIVHYIGSGPLFRYVQRCLASAKQMTLSSHRGTYLSTSMSSTGNKAISGKGGHHDRSTPSSVAQRSSLICLPLTTRKQPTRWRLIKQKNTGILKQQVAYRYWNTRSWVCDKETTQYRSTQQPPTGFAQSNSAV